MLGREVLQHGVDHAGAVQNPAVTENHREMVETLNGELLAPTECPALGPGSARPPPAA